MKLILMWVKYRNREKVKESEMGRVRERYVMVERLGRDEDEDIDVVKYMDGERKSKVQDESEIEICNGRVGGEVKRRERSG